MLNFRGIAAVSGVLASLVLGAQKPSWATEVQGWTKISVLHTNDLHSHFRPERTPLALGGVARLKTAIDRARADNPHSLLLDGGDWSEGQVYYLAGSDEAGPGVESIRMLDHLGYDAVVVGNHDWLNGPENLLRTLKQVQPRFQALAMNLKLEGESPARAQEIRRWIPPYTVKRVGQARVALIGVLTYEKIYDTYLKPWEVTQPFSDVAALAKQLKQSGQADAVVVISHNRVSWNTVLLETATDVDLVVGAHDHVKLVKPVVVARKDGRRAWLVEAGKWGRYLGRVELWVHPVRHEVALSRYRLEQMDRSVPEAPETLAQIERVEALLAQTHPSYFDLGHIADVHTHLENGGVDNRMGSLVTDAYRAYAGTNLAFEQQAFVYGGMEPGDVRKVDVFNAMPAVYNGRTGQSWTLKTFTMKGSSLLWYLDFLFATRAYPNFGKFAGSGLELTFKPVLDNNSLWVSLLQKWSWVEFFKLWLSPSYRTVIQSLSINGQGFDKDRDYTIAAGGWIVETVGFINSMLPSWAPELIKLRNYRDTRVEDWRIAARHMETMGRIRPEDLPLGRRVRSAAPDLGLDPDGVTLTQMRDGTSILRARVVNWGASASPPGALVHWIGNHRGLDLGAPADEYEVAQAFMIGSLQAGEARVIEWRAPTSMLVKAPDGLLSVDVRLTGGGLESEDIRTNHELTRYFETRQSSEPVTYIGL